VTDALELHLAARFDALANSLDDSDWLDVRRRARVPRRWLAVPVAATVAALVVASAFGVYRQVVDFFSAEPAPERIVQDYGQLSARATIGMGPRVLPHEARKVMDVEWHGKAEPFYVAPTEDGGFCYRWGTGGSCGRILRLHRPVGLGYLDSEHGPTEVHGHVLDADVARVELRYADGTATEIPIVWVSPPIDAGFFAYDVPEAQEQAGHGATALVAFDKDGGVIQQTEFPRTDPRWESGPDGLPRIADRTQKRTLFDFRDESGGQWTLVTAPAPGAKLCYAYNGGGGCLSPRFPASIETFGGVQNSGSAVNICCALPDWVAAVELRYEDGEREKVKPVDGFLLYVIPRAHYSRGHRLERLVFLDAAGGEHDEKAVETDRKGMYPCTKDEEIDLGYGAKVCP
jgi:hypothetical protein